MRKHFRSSAVAMAAMVVAVFTMVIYASGGAGLFDRVDAVEALKEARGTVYDLSQGPWVISGEWVLDCEDACAEADLNDIKFDLAHAMVKPDGATSHSHQYSDFSATRVTAGADDLTINGTITGSGPVGTNDIVIKLVGVASGNGTFFFELPGNAHLAGEIGGVIVESED